MAKSLSLVSPLYPGWDIHAAGDTTCSPSLTVTSWSPRWTLNRKTIVSQCAAVKTVLELRSDPPQKGREPHFLTNDTCQGNSFFSAGSPPTILLLLTEDTPHSQAESVEGLVVTVGGGLDGFGLGGQITILQLSQQAVRKIEIRIGEYVHMAW